MTSSQGNTEEFATSLTDLADKYEDNYNILVKRIYELEEILETAKGNDVYLLNKKIKIYEEMANESRYLAKYLRNYYEEKRGHLNENGFYRQGLVGVHYAVFDTCKCSSL